jgi:hypothetical protein
MRYAIAGYLPVIVVIDRAIGLTIILVAQSMSIAESNTTWLT